MSRKISAKTEEEKPEQLLRAIVVALAVLFFGVALIVAITVFAVKMGERIR